jgi:hypothetical protein
MIAFWPWSNINSCLECAIRGTAKRAKMPGHFRLVARSFTCRIPPATALGPLGPPLGFDFAIRASPPFPVIPMSRHNSGRATQVCCRGFGAEGHGDDLWSRLPNVVVDGRRGAIVCRVYERIYHKLTPNHWVCVGVGVGVGHRCDPEGASKSIEQFRDTHVVKSCFDEPECCSCVQVLYCTQVVHPVEEIKCGSQDNQSRVPTRRSGRSCRVEFFGGQRLGVVLSRLFGVACDKAGEQLRGSRHGDLAMGMEVQVLGGSCERT